MYDNISVEQSGQGLGRILKTSPDLSMVAVIANARQGENVSLLWATVSRNGPGDVEMGESLGGNETASLTFLSWKTYQ